MSQGQDLFWGDYIGAIWDITKGLFGVLQRVLTIVHVALWYIHRSKNVTWQPRSRPMYVLELHEQQSSVCILIFRMGIG